MASILFKLNNIVKDFSAVGDNGFGKSILIKILSGGLTPASVNNVNELDNWA